MPRRHKSPIERQLPKVSTNERTKNRYATKQAALNAAREQQKYELHVTLHVYQSLHDGGWYLTSSQQQD